MTRKKVTLAYITNDSERKASFRKRKKGLINKVRELSTLCDVDACAIIYSPYDQEPEVWPSWAQAEAVLARFRSLSVMDRTPKMVNQESFTRLRMKKTHIQLVRLQKDRKRREMKNFMFRCFAGMASLNDLDMRNSVEMEWVINQTLRELTARMDAMQINGHDASASRAAVEAPAAGADRDAEVVAPPQPVDEDYLEGFMLDLVQSSTGASGCGLGWDIAVLPYPHFFNNSSDQLGSWREKDFENE